MIKYLAQVCIIIHVLFPPNANAGWQNFVTMTNIFLGEVASNLTVGAPLSVSSTGTVTSGIPFLTTGQITATQNLSTATPTQMTSMTLSDPAAGTWIVSFGTTVQTGTGGNSITIYIYLNTTASGEARTIQFPTATLIDSGYPSSISFVDIPIAVNGSQNINIFWSTSASAAQQSTVLNRRLSAWRQQ